MDQSANGSAPQLSDLEQRHHQYDQQLSELSSKPYLSPDEALEETRLKKLKLQIKDQLQSLGSEQESGGTSTTH